MANTDEERLVSWLAGITDIHDQTMDFLSQLEGAPSADSIAYKELVSNSASADQLRDSYKLGHQLINIGGDHMIGFRTLAKSESSTVAPYTCVRGTVEGCALAVWILSCNLNGSERLKRYYAYRYNCLEQEKKYAHSEKLSNKERGVANQIDKIVNQAQHFGLASVLDKNGCRIGIGMPMPNITEIISNHIGEEPANRCLSAIAHAHHWAYSQLCFAVGESDAGEKHMFKHIDPVVLAWLCMKSASAFWKASREMCELFGGDIDELQNLFETALPDIKL